MKIYFVSSNKHKYIEFRRILRDVIDINWINADYLEPQSDNLIDVAITSAKWLSHYIEEPFFLEDAGLFIDALGGFPGVYSSYVFKKLGNDGVLRLLDGVEDRSARFVSVIALHIGGRITIFEGIVEGSISEEIRGGGWGFDPIFIPNGSNGKTYGELGENKDLFSHRGRSAAKLRDFIGRLVA